MSFLNFFIYLNLLYNNHLFTLTENQRSRSQQERTSNLTDISHFIDKEDEQSNRSTISKF